MWKISYLYQKQHRVGTMLLYYSYVTFQYRKDFLQLCHSAQLRSTSVLFILLLMISSSQCHFQNSLKTALYYQQYSYKLCPGVYCCPGLEINILRPVVIYSSILNYVCFILLHAVTCKPLSSPYYGAITCSLRDYGVPSYEVTCSFTCNTGYELIGSDTRTCQSDGSWSDSEPWCRIGEIC